MSDLQVKRDAAFNTCYVDPGPFGKPGQTSALAAITGGGGGGGGGRRRPGRRGRRGKRGKRGKRGEEGDDGEKPDALFFCMSTRTELGAEVRRTGGNPPHDWVSLPCATVPTTAAPAPIEWTLTMSKDFDWEGSSTIEGPQVELVETVLINTGFENTFRYTGDREAIVRVQVAASVSSTDNLVFDIENVEIGIAKTGGAWAPACVVLATDVSGIQYIDLVVLNIISPDGANYATQIVAECIVHLNKDDLVTAAIRNVTDAGSTLELQSAQVTGIFLGYSDD